MKNIIFLDIDGVLNNYNADPALRSKSRCGNFTGIDKDKTLRLAKIVNETNAYLILVSTWKTGWVSYEYEYNDFYHIKYLKNHLWKKGKLKIIDITKEQDTSMRGHGIKKYLSGLLNVKNWIVLDDEIFPDYEELNILPHLIKIDGNIGLTDKDVDAAIKILQEK